MAGKGDMLNKMVALVAKKRISKNFYFVKLFWDTQLLAKNYFNNHILLKLKLDKNYIIRFVFDYENKVIGIWLDAINY